MTREKIASLILFEISFAEAAGGCDSLNSHTWHWLMTLNGAGVLYACSLDIGIWRLHKPTA